ncbi:MAG: transposase [Candidatus Omnitrophica bacterium]|nr:transposase [Candidatus Omnitrophota bacterium]MDD5736733.1 transposase [Candidatus Omnitrophota bacterium]
MPRKPRCLVDDGFYHIMSRGHNKCKLFHARKDFEQYKSLIFEHKQTFPCEIYHYCFMPNHVHILLKMKYGNDLPSFMQHINQNFANYSKRLYGTIGNLFQGRYKGLIVETDGYLLECGRYIERNPLKSGLENNLSQYAFSSFNFYARGEEDEILTPNPLYLELSKSEEERRMLYVEYVLKERLEDHIKDSS